LNATEQPKFGFEPLASVHDRAAFSCGVPVLDNYLKTQARQDSTKRIAAVYIMTPDGKIIAGYYTLSQYAIQSSDVPAEHLSKLTKHATIPATLIGRLARDLKYRGTGELLLMNALERCLIASRQVASWATVVDAKDDEGAHFYKNYGFESFPSRPLKLFLPTATIEKIFGRT
jgi:predicted GNAT family N-acyltransferase